MHHSFALPTHDRRRSRHWNKAIRPAHVGQRNGRCLRRWPPPQKWQRMMKSGPRSTKCLVIAIQVGRIYFVVISVVSRDPIICCTCVGLCEWIDTQSYSSKVYDDVVKWKHFPRFRTFVRRIHRSLVDSPHKVQWRGILMCSLIYAWRNSWANMRHVGVLRLIMM